MRLRQSVLTGLVVAAALAGAMPAAAQPAPAEPTLQKDPANWPTYSGDHTSQRHSPLKQVNTDNVTTLQAAWIYNMYLQRDMQATPVVHNGVMYVSAYNRIDALDARTGMLIWQYQRGQVATGSQRGTAFWNNRVFVTTTDKHLVALDARSGAILWDVETGNGYQPAGGAPLVVGGKLIVSGNFGGPVGGQGGFVQGYDALTGKHLWTWSALPKESDPEYKTWGGARPQGGPVWLSGSYDPDLNLIYYGSGQPNPQWNGDPRPGDNLFSDSVVAIDPNTGKMKWHFQFTPHDVHDWDAGQQSILVDAPWKGKPRKLMLWASRNGFYYILDRSTGEFLQATKFVSEVNWLLSMDAKGRPTSNPAASPTAVGVGVCPSTAGATNWPSPSYDPALKLFFVVAQEGCSINFRDKAGSNDGGGYTEDPNKPWQLYTRAIDAFTGEKKWDYKQTTSIRYGPGLLSTAGGIVFSGEKLGQISALDSRTGQPLWHFFTGGVITSGPMSYAIDGKQYVALVSGSNVIAFTLPDGPAATAAAESARARGGVQ
jgi:alcohol dehydrogenase (cytochrome c)